MPGGQSEVSRKLAGVLSHPQSTRRIMDLMKAQIPAFSRVRGEEKARGEHNTLPYGPGYFSLHSPLKNTVLCKDSLTFRGFGDKILQRQAVAQKKVINLIRETATKGDDGTESLENTLKKQRMQRQD